MVHSNPSSAVVVLTWLCWPRTTWPTMISVSITPVSTMKWPSPWPRRRRRCSREIIQASVVPKSTNDTANLSGLSQIGSLFSSRSSNMTPPSATIAITALAAANTINERCQLSAGRSRVASGLAAISDMYASASTASGSPVAGALSGSGGQEPQDRQHREETEQVDQRENTPDVVRVAHRDDTGRLGSAAREPDEVDES